MQSTEAVLKMGLLQFTPVAGALQENWKKVKGAVERARSEGAELVLLPELWATGPLVPGQGLDSRAIEAVVSEVRTLARTQGLWIVGTFPETVTDGGEKILYNTTRALGPGEEEHLYRKIHLFAPMDEHRIFSPGREAVTWSLAIHGTLICVGLLTCYDLRFPELCRHLAFQGAELILVSALWPEVRRRHFDILLEARAIENQCFMAGVNGWGDVGGTRFGGGSKIVGPAGELTAVVPDMEAVVVAEIHTGEVRRIRSKFNTALPPRQWWPRPEEKVVDPPALREVVLFKRRAGQKMVFTNGCFDILHAGHASYLEEARRLGDFLVVGLNSDASVRGIKGPGRPVIPQQMRAELLAAMACVDHVVVFDEPTPIRLIRDLMPDRLVKGADWKEEEIVGAAEVREAGGEVVRIPFVRDLSTSKIIRRITQHG